MPAALARHETLQFFFQVGVAITVVVASRVVRHGECARVARPHRRPRVGTEVGLVLEPQAGVVRVIDFPHELGVVEIPLTGEFAGAGDDLRLEIRRGTQERDYARIRIGVGGQLPCAGISLC